MALKENVWLRTLKLSQHQPLKEQQLTFERAISKAREKKTPKPMVHFHWGKANMAESKLDLFSTFHEEYWTIRCFFAKIATFFSTCRKKSQFVGKIYTHAWIFGKRARKSSIRRRQKWHFARQNAWREPWRGLGGRRPTASKSGLGAGNFVIRADENVQPTCLLRASRCYILSHFRVKKDVA